MKRYNILLVSGYSGAGKTYALKYLENLSYYCVDNLPIKLLGSFMSIYMEGQSSEASTNIAIGVDVRSTMDFEHCKEIIDDLKKKGCTVKLLFITAEKNILIQRYQETRSPHPLTTIKVPVRAKKTKLGLDEAIDLEFALLEPLRKVADLTIDTSDSTVHDLKKQIFYLFSIEEGKQTLVVRVISFGFSKGLPADIDLLFDVRFLPNPHFDPKLRPLTGIDTPVKKFIEKQKVFSVFWDRLVALFDILVPEYTKEGKTYLTIGVGCTGGRHRSVMIAQKVAEYFETKNYKCMVEHRDIYIK